VRKDRDWTRARAKVEEENRCRVSYLGGCNGPLAAAHTIGRTHDETNVVMPNDVIPLCTQHHAEYDSRQISILEAMTYSEQAAAVRKIGIIRALKRLTGGQRENP
jgi:hypothetical protein